MSRLITLAGVSALLAALVLGASAGATSTTTCVGGPHCYSTIQAAVDAARDGDTIRIGPGTFAGGLTITKNLTLAGVDPHASRIAGGGPVVTIGSTTAAPTVTLTNLTITGGLTTSNPHAPDCGLDVPVCGPGYAVATAIGGGIETFAGTKVTVSNSIITGNRATPALTTASVKATCANGPCVAAFGDAAGIDVWGTMALIDSTVSDNHASAPAQSNGGGIAVHSGATLSLQSSRVTGNSASATAPSGRFASGGGIFVNRDGTLTVDDSSIDDNSAVLASSLASPYPIQDVSPDQSNAIGGGIFLNDGSIATIRNSTLDGNGVFVNTPLNQAWGADAALCACGGVTLSLENSRVEQNALTVVAAASDNNGPSGPATLEADGDGDRISNTHIDWNTATITTTGDSAGMVGTAAFFPGGDVATTIENSTVSHNTIAANAPNGDATLLGAGIVDNGVLSVTGSNIEANHGVATGLGGEAQGGGVWNGALFGPPFSSLTLQSSRVEHNVLSGSAGVALVGGGVWNAVDPGFSITLQDAVVAHNAPDDCVGC
jgi:hypothetical protein